MAYSKHWWTKEDMLKVAKLWESKTTIQLAEDIGVPKQSVSCLASRIRAVTNGRVCPKKVRKGYLDLLLKDTFMFKKVK